MKALKVFGVFLALILATLATVVIITKVITLGLSAFLWACLLFWLLYLFALAYSIVDGNGEVAASPTPGKEGKV